MRPGSLLKYSNRPHAKDAKASGKEMLCDVCALGVRLFQQSASSLLKYPFAGHSERSAAAGEGGAARSRGTPSKVRSAREADKHRLLQPCRTRLTRGPSTSLRPLCRLRSARDDHAFEVFQQAAKDSSAQLL